MRMPNFSIKIFVLHIIIFILPLHGYALEKATHEVINEYIAEHLIDGFSFDQYLKEQLGFQEGWKEVFNNKRVSQWLGYGGRTEDEPLYRSFRHFHNPLESWDKAGLKGGYESSIIWGQSSDQYLWQLHSWQDVRDYFYQALIAHDGTTREEYFAETFQGLGQLMHLVEDASVPLHTRDDAHVIFNYEKWIEAFRTDKNHPENLITFNGWLSNDTRYGYDKSVLDLASNPLAPIPIARIIDTDKYTGSNPDVTIHESIGIAEYSNANFFTKDTKFGDFPSPNWDGVQWVDYAIQDPRDPSYTVFRPYYKKNINPPALDGDTGYRLATVGYLFDYATRYFPSLTFGLRVWEKPALDGNVYQDYAERLIPRAVGYSSGLLEYFFRGQLEVTSLPIFLDNNIYALWLKIKNVTTSQEVMEDGKFTVVCRYTPDGGNPDGSDDIFVRAYDVNCDEVQYQGEEEFFFYFPSDEPIPIERYESLKCMLVFKGILGNEDGAVIGKFFTTGEIKFNEEWDNGLDGNYDWNHMTQDDGYYNYPDNGSTSNEISQDNKLIKDNVRFIGKYRDQFNPSWLEFEGDGILITPDMYLQIKIDNIWITPFLTDHTQNILLGLTVNGDPLNLILCQDGHCFWHSYFVPWIKYTYDFDNIIVANIYSLIQNAGIEITGSIYLTNIQISQQIVNYYNTPAATEEHQHMEVDFIRLIEQKLVP